jgi:DNA-binding beta-propeller fold protein YncE
MKTICLKLAATACAIASPAAQAATIVLGGYPDQLQFIDDVSGKVVQKVTLETGLPDNIQLSADRSKIYVTTLTTSGIEVLDATSRKVLNKFSLNTPTTRYRFMGGVPDPTGRYFYTVGQHYDKEIDLYRVSKPQYIVIDMKAQKIVRSVDIDKDDESPSYRTRAAISPDGKTLYVFDKKIRVIDTATLKVADRIDLAKPDDPGMRDVNMGGSLDTLNDPNAFVSLFNAADPYIHNKVFGIARFNLTSREFKFTPIGPAPDSMAGLQVTPDGKNGYTVAETGKLGSKRCEFWHFDLTTNQALEKAEFPCRSRYYFGMSRDGKKLYIYGAGFEISVFDAATLKHEQDWAFGNDITMAGILNTP